MPDKIDKQGTIYEEGWDGKHRPQQGFFGTKQDTDWLGNANVEKDWLGNPKAETDWFGTQKRAADGTPLYKRKGSSSSSSSSSDGDLVGWLLLVAVIVAIGAILVLVWPFLVVLWRMLKTRDGRLALLACVLGIGIVGAVPLVVLPFVGGYLSIINIQARVELVWIVIGFLSLVLTWGCIARHWAAFYFRSVGIALCEYLAEAGVSLQRIGGWF